MVVPSFHVQRSQSYKKSESHLGFPAQLIYVPLLAHSTVPWVCSLSSTSHWPVPRKTIHLIPGREHQNRKEINLMACTGSAGEIRLRTSEEHADLKKSLIMWHKLLANHSVSKSNKASCSELLISLKQHQKTLLQSEYSCKLSELQFSPSSLCKQRE